MLRALIAVYGLAALGFAAIWVVGVVELVDPNFNEDRTLGDYLLIAQAVVGLIGVLATLVASGAGFAFAGTATRRWLAWVGISSLCAPFSLLARARWTCWLELTAERSMPQVVDC